jgi:hypothetical protein
MQNRSLLSKKIGFPKLKTASPIMLGGSFLREEKGFTKQIVVF